MENRISLIIPVYNGAGTIGECLEAVYSSTDKPSEVIVVDDCSTDNSIDIIKTFPCRLIRLNHHVGSSKARNIGAKHSHGEILVFIDADCLIMEDALSLAGKTMDKLEQSIVVGGTYRKLPADNNFFSIFQSIFIHFFECKNSEKPDYIAAHAFIISSKTFKKSGGFPEYFLPIIEDVEFSHRLRKSGCCLLINPDIQVRHIFNFNLFKSLKNAYQKTKYWIVYSLANKDLLADSGTASRELKFNVAAFLFLLILWLLNPLISRVWIFGIFSFVVLSNLTVNRNLFFSFYSTKGAYFTVLAIFYYVFIYPIPILLGVVAGLRKYFLSPSPI